MARWTLRDADRAAWVIPGHEYLRYRSRQYVFYGNVTLSLKEHLDFGSFEVQ
jgi:hypothetical protein